MKQCLWKKDEKKGIYLTGCGHKYGDSAYELQPLDGEDVNRTKCPWCCKEILYAVDFSAEESTTVIVPGGDVVKKYITVPDYFTKGYHDSIDTLLRHLNGLTVCKKENVDNNITYTCVVRRELLPMLEVFNKSEVFIVED